MITMDAPVVEESWLLVTTSRSILLLDPRVGAGFRLDTGRGAYYGISILHGSIYVAARRRLAISPFHVSEGKGEILVFDSGCHFKKTIEAPFPLREMHQILGWNGQLWVTCTFDNMIAIFDGKTWEKWHPKGIPNRELLDQNHFNSLAVIDGRLCIVAHNHRQSEILLFDMVDRTLRESILLGIQAHNVWKDGGWWMTCSSAEGKLLRSDGFSIRTGGFPRGVASVDDRTYVGISTNSERSLRDFSNSWIQIYDCSWRRLGTVDLVREGIVLDLFPVCVAKKNSLLQVESVQFEMRWESNPSDTSNR